MQFENCLMVSFSRKFAFEYEEHSMNYPFVGWERIKETKSRTTVVMTVDRAHDILSMCEDRMGMGGEGYEFSAGRLRMFSSAAKAVREALGIEEEEDQ